MRELANAPFRAREMPAAYRFGLNEGLELHVGHHMYFELEFGALDLARFRFAWVPPRLPEARGASGGGSRRRHLTRPRGRAADHELGDRSVASRFFDGARAPPAGAPPAGAFRPTGRAVRPRTW